MITERARLPLVKTLLSPLLCALLLATTALRAADTPPAAPVVFIAGDSTAADNSHHPESPQRGWGQPFADLVLPPAKLDNRARAGRSTKSYRDEKHWDKLIADLKKDDWVIIQFGHNDEKADTPKVSAPADGAYRHNLRRYIAEVRAHEGHPVLATSVARRQWDQDGKFVDSLAAYVAAARAIATEEKVPLLELHDLTVAMEKAAGVEGSKKLHLWPGKKDDTHYSDYGARRVAALAAAEIHRLKLPLAAWIKLPPAEQ